MRLPIIKGNNIYRKSTVTFGGLNLLKSFSEGELEDCTGVSHLAYPAITSRQKSEEVFLCDSPLAMLIGNKEFIVTSDGLYCQRKKVASLPPGDRKAAVFGDKIVIFPDKVYYDADEDKLFDLQGKCSSEGAKITFTANKIVFPQTMFKESIKFEEICFPATEKIVTYETATVREGELILDGFKLKTGEELYENGIIREKCDANQYRKIIAITKSPEGENYNVETEVVTVENCMKKVFSQLKEGDVVEISGCVNIPDNNISAEIISVGENELTFSDASFIAGEETGEVIIKRKIPDFSCICSYENRLWGCEGNTIYASALGDATNYFVYRNLSTDSFTVESNTPGDFTACTPYGNCCLFFKENSCYKLYGNRPSNFQLTESFGSGIMHSDAGSIVNVNGKLVYKGNGGVFAFYGGIPGCVSQKLEGITMENAVAGSDGKRYFITADTKEGRREFVWDIDKNLWSKSGETETQGYSFFAGNLYRLTKNGISRILEEADDGATWSITLCPFDEDYYKTKNYSRLYVHGRLFKNAYLHTEICYDDGIWQSVNTQYADEMKYLNIPCFVKGCHSIKLRLSGKGKCILESITREFSLN